MYLYVRMHMYKFQTLPTCSPAGLHQLDHSWVAHHWLPDLGLPQYTAAFERHLVDGRLLNVLTRKDYEKHLGVTRKFHQVSVLHGVELLRKLGFDKEVRDRPLTLWSPIRPYPPMLYFPNLAISARKNCRFSKIFHIFPK